MWCFKKIHELRFYILRIKTCNVFKVLHIKLVENLENLSSKSNKYFTTNIILSYKLLRLVRFILVISLCCNAAIKITVFIIYVKAIHQMEGLILERGVFSFRKSAAEDTTLRLLAPKYLILATAVNKIIAALSLFKH